MFLSVRVLTKFLKMRTSEGSVVSTLKNKVFRPVSDPMSPVKILVRFVTVPRSVAEERLLFWLYSERIKDGAVLLLPPWRLLRR